MNGITLPPIPGAIPASDSRPNSRSSSCSTSMTIVPHVYYTDHAVFRPTPRSQSVPRAYGKLPSLRNNCRKGYSRQSSDISARYSAKYRQTPRSGSIVSANSPFLPQSTTEDCLKCLLRVPHKKCESHKYIRVGGGYRHGFWYIKCLLEELEMQRQRELLRQQRLEAIKETNVKAIKTYIRTKSGRLVERIVFLNEEDYEAFKQGKNVDDILKRYLNKDEAAGLESWDKDEVKAIKTLVRTKSGRLIEKLVYVSKKDYDDIKTGKKDAKDLLKKYVKDGEKIEGWDEAKMKTIKTYVRTKSGRLVEKVIMISQDDYDAMIKEGKDPSEIIKKYIPLEEGEKLESWQSAEPMKAIKTKVRTKSGRIIEKTIYVSADDYDKMTKGGGDPNDILKKYLNAKDGDTLESWEKAPDGQPMKVVKTYIRTKSGRLIEKQIMLTEDEYQAFQESGGDPEFLKKFIKLGKGEEIEDWEKASTIYSATDDPEVQGAPPGSRIVGKDGAVYEVVVDPVTGKKYKKKVGQQESDVDSGIASMSRGKGGKRRGGKGGGIEEEETAKERARRKQGKRDEDSDSAYSYKSYKSEGGTRHVRRKRKKADGTYSDSESYHSSQDEEGEARRRRRRRERKHGSGSAHSYTSVVSAGGTRHVRRRRRRADGTYSASESYHSSDSDKPGGRRAEKKKKKKKRREHGSDSEHSYFSEVSEGGTHHRKRKKRIRDKDGNVIGYEGSEVYTSPEHSDDESVYTEVSDGKGGKVRVKKEKPGKGGKKGKGKKGRYATGVFSDESSDSDDVDFENMTAEEKKEYLEKKAKRKAEREKRRREKYGDKYDEMVAKHEALKKAARRKPVFSDESSDDDEVDLENMTEEEKKKYFEEKAKRKAEREKRRREKYGDKYDEMLKEHEKRKKERRNKPVFSDESSDDDDVDLENMTEEEKKKYFEEKAKRKAEREQRRREKYGDKYDEMLKEHEKQRKEKRREELRRRALESATPPQQHKPKNTIMDVLDSSKSGYGKDGRKKQRKGGDGNEADDESDDGYDITGRRKKKGGHRPGSGDGFEYKYDSKGRIISKKRIKKDGESSGSEYEYEYDEDGNVKTVKKKNRKGSAESDGDYFEVDEKGQIKLKEGKKKIDISKLTADDLRKLGIDPNLSKHEIARLLKDKFGDQIRIVDKKKTVGTRKLSDYDSDVKTDDLANDSDLDISTLRGPRRVNVLMKRGGQTILEHIRKVMDQSNLQEDYAKDLDEKGDIDFLSHYRLVDTKKLESYARCFAVEDDDYDTVINSDETRIALDGVPSLQQMTPKQMEYVLKVLKIDDASQITFRMFAVISALSERVTQMDPVAKHLIEICDLLDIQRKMDLYKAMFYCNINSDRNSNFIKADSLRIELIAGGLNWKQQEYIMERLQPNYFNEISFLDYICYIPLFLSMHDNICDNPLDMSSDKYESLNRKPSGGHRQRDMNPLGQPLSKESPYQLREQAQDLLEGRINIEDVKYENREIIQKYTTRHVAICGTRVRRNKGQSDKDKNDRNTRRGSKDTRVGDKMRARESKNKAARNSSETSMDREMLPVRKLRERNSDNYSPEVRLQTDASTRDTVNTDEKQFVSQTLKNIGNLSRDELRDVMNSAHSYYSYVSDGGTRHIKRRRRHDDGTYSDSESCDDDYIIQRYEDIKKAKERLGIDTIVKMKQLGKKKRKDDTNEQGSRRPSWLPPVVPSPHPQEEGGEREVNRAFSVHSEVSEGGTRRRFKRKVLRDDDGNIVGYGSPELYTSPRESDEESIRLRRGSISDDEECRAQSKKALKRLQKMIERPKRRQVGQQNEDIPGKPWVEEVLDGLPIKRRNAQKKILHEEDKKLDLQLPDMPTAVARTYRKSTLPHIEEDEYFSDSSDEEVDLSAMTEEERRVYLEEKEKRRQDRERRMREKFGDKYEEMKRKRKEQKETEARAKAEAAAAAEAELAASASASSAAGDGKSGGNGRRPSGPRRDSTTLQQGKLKQKPKSMVSYELGPARDVGGTIEKSDARDIGPSHRDWAKKTSKAKDLPKKSRDDGFLFDYKPTKISPLKLATWTDNERKSKKQTKELHVSFAESPDGVFEDDDACPKNDIAGDELGVFEIGEDGQLKVKEGEEIDLNRISSAVLRKLGIDPTLSKEEIIHRLKDKLGNKIVIKDGVFAVGTKPISAYDLSKVTDEMLADDKELDINTLKGPRRVNVLMRKGGEELRAHVRRVIDECRHFQKPNYATNLDETESSIDFLSHYRLVDPGKIEGYARAFVVEDRDLDTVISFLETQTALDGVNSIQHMTSKQMHYVLKILNIDDASQVTFRMFAVITALCERVTQMDCLSKHLLEICNLADIERKLDLYKAMFYHNVRSDRQSNFITEESLKIELIAGGLSWKQQQFVMDKMEANSWGEISFLDYMCYIPLFLSMHDNICDNPLDMSDQKYVIPPRQRPPSAQRDMNPLGQSLSKFSSFLLKKQARDLREGRLDPEVVREEQLQLLRAFANLPDIDTFDKPKYEEEDEDRIDLIY